ncbi:hypothetical protein BD414DRAFT_378495, partial [Trametes punicea]
MRRQWTDSSREAWINRRREYCERRQRPDPLVLRGRSLEREREFIEKNLLKYVEVYAWEMDKHPLNQHPAPFAGKLFLPLQYMHDDKEQVIHFHEGEDLNFLVYRFYDSPPADGFQGLNFITGDYNVGVPRRRHRYLGPQPYVAGYRFNDKAKTARIEWLDKYTKTMWIGKERWKVELYFDDAVGGWVSRPRGDHE